MKKEKPYLITYHNDNTKHAIWATERYCFETRNPKKYWVMKETNALLRDPYSGYDIAAGIRMMLKYDGFKLN